jgi:hypothetical protein
MLNRQGSSNGFSTLAHIDRRLQDTRSHVHEIELKAEQSSQKLAAISNDEAETYTELATISLDVLDNAEGLKTKLTTAERKAKGLLTQRAQTLEGLVQETERSLEEQTKLEKERERQAEAIEAVAEQLHEQVEKTQARLAGQADYKAAQESAQQAVDTVNAAQAKALRSNKELQEKASQYGADLLFTYLWKRHYGTQAYRAGRITRVLDEWVADHVGYEESRRNYYMLQEIPKRLDAHVEALHEDAAKKMAELERLEHVAETEDGTIALEDKLVAMKETLDEADQAIEREEIHYGKCMSQRDEYARAEDDYYRKAVAVLHDGLKNQSLDELRRQAALTEGYEDDSLVSRLGELRLDKQAIKQAHHVTQRSSRQLAERLHGLERIRRDFKQRSFDAPHSQFSNSQAVTGAVDDFVGGLINISELWRIVERSQRFIQRRTYPNHGRHPSAVRFPRGIRIPSNWGGLGGGGIGRSGGGGFRLPGGGGGSGGGGFRTGGGF